MKGFVLSLLNSLTITVFSQQQQQLSNTMNLNNSSVQILSNNSRGSVSNINTLNNRNSNIAIQSNVIKVNQVRVNSQRNTTKVVRMTNKANQSSNVVRSRNKTNIVSVSGPNNRSDLTNLHVNDNPINTNSDNNLGNQFDNQQLLIENNANLIQSQQTANASEQNNKVAQNVSANNSKGINVSLDLNVRVHSFSSSSAASSSKTNRHIFSKKMKKFERHFLGKIGSHKKSKHLVDVCFNWK